MEAFTDDKLNDTRNIEFVFNRVYNIVGKGEDVGKVTSIVSFL